MGKKRRQMFRKKFAGHPRSRVNKAEEVVAEAPAPKPVEVKKPEPKPAPKPVEAKKPEPKPLMTKKPEPKPAPKAEVKKPVSKPAPKAENKKPAPKPVAKETLRPSKKKKK